MALQQSTSGEPSQFIDPTCVRSVRQPVGLGTPLRRVDATRSDANRTLATPFKDSFTIKVNGNLRTFGTMTVFEVIRGELKSLARASEITLSPAETKALLKNIGRNLGISLTDIQGGDLEDLIVRIDVAIIQYSQISGIPQAARISLATEIPGIFSK